MSPDGADGCSSARLCQLHPWCSEKTKHHDPQPKAQPQGKCVPHVPVLIPLPAPAFPTCGGQSHSGTYGRAAGPAASHGHSSEPGTGIPFSRVIPRAPFSTPATQGDRCPSQPGKPGSHTPPASTIPYGSTLLVQSHCEGCACTGSPQSPAGSPRSPAMTPPPSGQTSVPETPRDTHSLLCSPHWPPHTEMALPQPRMTNWNLALLLHLGKEGTAA